MKVEREITDLRRTQYMSDKIGKSFTGTIVNVTQFGFFVELVEIFVEGLVHVSSLADDYYIYIEQDHKWRGQRRNKIYKIGDLVKVRVKQVDISLRRIDLALL
jgi:ribonuclease R